MSRVVKTVPLDKIRIDSDVQARVEIDYDVVQQYRQEMSAGVKFPEPVVFFDGEWYWVGDGIHRRLAHEGDAVMPVEVREGTIHDARWYAAGANKAHGLRRTNADKRRAVEIALKERPDLSDRAIAEHVGVHPDTVGERRRQLVESGDVSDSDTRTDTLGRQQPATKPDRKKPDPTSPDRGKAEAERRRHLHPEDVDHQPMTDAELEHAESSSASGKPPRSGQQSGAGDPPRKKRRHEPLAPMQDAEGNDVPEHLRDVFGDGAMPAALARLEALAEDLDADSIINPLRARLSSLPYLRAGDLLNQLDSAAGSLSEAIETVKAGLPHSLCPSCAGAGCNDCRKAGYVPSWRLAELKELAS